MKINDVPQDNGIIEDHVQEICYAVNKQGQYTLAHSLGWNAKNIVNDQAWELIFQEIKKIHEKVINNKLSPLAFHMTKNQMDPELLGKYVSIAKWRVKRHLKPNVFKRLCESMLKNYADLFNITVEELKTVPDEINLKTIISRS